MALSNLVYTAGNAPDHTAAMLHIIANKPDVYGAFSKGYDDAQKRALALEQYKQAKLKTDLATALYPQQTAYQQALLQARLNAVNNPTTYNSNPSVVTPVDTSNPVKKVITQRADGTTIEQNPNDPGTPPKVYHPDNPFNGPSDSLFQNPQNSVPQNNPMIPGLADNSDSGTPLAGGDFNSSDFIS